MKVSEYNEGVNSSSQFDKLSAETREKTLAWIASNILPSKKFKHAGKVTSYNYKHRMEEDSGLYITNGSFKGAMLASGYMPYDSAELSWEFKASGPTEVIRK